MRRMMSKEEFLVIPDRQQQGGLTIKDFCKNKTYSASYSHYWKSKYVLHSHSSGSPFSSTEFADFLTFLQRVFW